MDNNDKKTDKDAVAVLPEETVSGKKKYTRKFTWTPARKAAFEKCIAARKTGAKPESKPESKPEPEPEPEIKKPKLKRQKEVIYESSSSEDELSSSSSDSIQPNPKKRKSNKTKKQFLRLNKELENIKRAINKTKPRAKPKREYIPQPIESEDEVETETPITNKKIPSYYFI
jgi:hypothetical protein